MTANSTEVENQEGDDAHLKSNMRKVAMAALAGTSIEWYDFFLYGTAAALIFPTAFFPESTPTMALILSFGTFAFGFIARPIGGILFVAVFLTPPAAIITAICGLASVARHPTELKGQGFASAALAISVAGIVLAVVARQWGPT